MVGERGADRHQQVPGRSHAYWRPGLRSGLQPRRPAPQRQLQLRGGERGGRYRLHYTDGCQRLVAFRD